MYKVVQHQVWLPALAHTVSIYRLFRSEGAFTNVVYGILLHKTWLSVIGGFFSVPFIFIVFGRVSVQKWQEIKTKQLLNHDKKLIKQMTFPKWLPYKCVFSNVVIFSMSKDNQINTQRFYPNIGLTQNEQLDSLVCK